MTIKIENYDVSRDTLEFSSSTNMNIEVKENYTIVNFCWVYISGGTDGN